ncbi:MAG: mitochondrial fission ELM1 family protein [Alphaproteobacteria bacterium]|nr:mitochondrial fission ELM1 family protein [Alphaproteobacteria bacterium]MDX5369545.1 mitochondrial fission ELM1 family protein [Alphaproteobacteria bacterium]MDX5464203.1 mitochondrial fission ELM1 family protein [Alphaproteobacteria bacterium]
MSDPTPQNSTLPADRPWRILLLSDGRPGHYRQSEAVTMALARRHALAVDRQEIRLRRGKLARPLGWLFASGLLSARGLLSLAYGLDAGHLPRPDLVVSTGGTTRLANVALARHYRVPNVYAGTLRGLPPRLFSAILLPYREAEGRTHHVITLKPSPVDPDDMPPARPWTGTAAEEGHRIAVLVGGPSGAHRFADADWEGLLGLLGHTGWPSGVRLLVTNSPRTPEPVSDRLAEAAREHPALIEEFVDFRTAGPGSILGLLSRADAVLCTEDSSSMIVEAICARRPVVALVPEGRSLRADEARMLDDLAADRLMAPVPLKAANPGGLVAALADLRPLAANPLDTLADAILGQIDRTARR